MAWQVKGRPAIFERGEGGAAPKHTRQRNPRALMVVWFAIVALTAVEPAAQSVDPARSAGAAPIVIEVGTINAENEGNWVQENIKSFRQAYPNIRVRAFEVNWPRRDEVKIEDHRELALNVLGITSQTGYEVQYLVDKDLLVPLDRFFPDPEFSLDLFEENLFDCVRYGGHVWGVPYLCSATAFICNWPLFEKAGIEAPPETWDQVLECARKMTVDTDGDGRPNQWGFRLGWNGRGRAMFYLWMTMVLQKGGDVMAGGRFDMSQPALREAYDFLRQLEASGAAVREDTRFRHMVDSGSARAYAMQIAPSYHLFTAKDKDLRLAHWPTFGRKVIADDKRQYLVIGKSTPEQEAASWAFIKWISRKDVALPERIPQLHMPCRKDIAERADYQDRVRPYCANFSLTHETKGWPVAYGMSSMGRYDAVTRFEQIITDLFDQKLSFDEAMEAVEVECNDIIRKATPSLRPSLLYASHEEGAP